MSDNRLQTTALSDNRRRQRLPVLRTLRGADHWVFILSGKSVNGGGIGEVRRASPAFLKGLQEARIRPAFFVIALDNDPAPGHPQHLQVSGLARQGLSKQCRYCEVIRMIHKDSGSRPRCHGQCRGPLLFLLRCWNPGCCWDLTPTERSDRLFFHQLQFSGQKLSQRIATGAVNGLVRNLLRQL